LKKPLILAFLILVIDQFIKIYIKTHFYLGREVHVAGNWFILHFTENNGMAYGMEFGGQYGKLFLTTFRILAIGVIFWYLLMIIKKKEDKLFTTCIALIFAGALGNIIDSVFYGVFFSESNGYIDGATFLPVGGGYSTLLHGKVVDMFYFPIIEGHFPEWFPFWGTEKFVFFQPVFNFADASISIGVAIIILYQKRFFGKKQITEEQENPTAAEEPLKQNP
jgi:signal peptidase II